MTVPAAVTGEQAIVALSQRPLERTKLLLCDGNGVIRNMRKYLDDFIPFYLGVELPPGTRATRESFEKYAGPGAALAFADFKASVHTMDIIYEAPAVRGAIESLVYLRERGFSTVVVTSRDTVEATVMAEWLRRQAEDQSIYEPLVDMVVGCAGTPKADILGSRRAHAIVDDTFEKIKDVCAERKYVLGPEGAGVLPRGIRCFPNGWLDATGKLVLAERIVRDSYSAPKLTLQR